jgi:hypothetical protein
MDRNLVERAKTFEFVALWWAWLMRYQDDVSNTAPPAPPFPHVGFGYRAGQFWPRGACSEDFSEEWEYFSDTLEVEQGLTGISINAIYCFQQYTSCRRFIDSYGTVYRFPD